MQQEQLGIEMKEILKYFNDSGILEKMIPSVVSGQFLKIQLESKLCSEDQFDVETIQKTLCDPIYDLLKRGGKRVRVVLCGLIAKYCGKDIRDVMEIAGFCEMVHNGTLIIDDIQDRSELRRDEMCVHKRYGTDIAINAANLMYFAPLSYLLKCDKWSETKRLEMGQVCGLEMGNAHYGQAWDLGWHNWVNSSIPCEEQYLQMAANKTGVLTRLAVRLCGIVLDIKEQELQCLMEYAQNIGIAFQIQDDILNLSGIEYSTKGLLGEDIQEGKITLMVIHSINNSNQQDSQRLLQILKSRTESSLEIKEAIQLLQKSGSLEYAQAKAKQLIEESIQNLKNQLSGQTQLLIQLAQMVIGRNK